MRIIRKFLVNTAFVSLIIGGVFSIFVIFAMNPLARELEDEVVQSESHYSGVADASERGENVKNIILIVVPLLGVVYVLYLWLYISRNIVRPLNKAVDFSNRLANGEFPDKIQTKGSRDEIAALIKTLNYLRDRLQTTINKLEKSHKREKSARLGAEQASNLKSKFLSKLSPELRTPLNAINGYIEIIREDIKHGTYDDALKKRMTKMAENAEILNRQVANLLDIGKLGGEDKYLNITEFSTVNFMRELLEYSVFCIEGRDITLMNHLSPKVPEKISTDRSILSLVLNSLIRALARVSGPGEIISCGCELVEDKLVFWVSDNRRAEQSENLAALFERLVPNSDFSKTATPSVLNMMLASAKAASINAVLGAKSNDDSACEFTLTFNAWDVINESGVKSQGTKIISNYAIEEEDFFAGPDDDHDMVSEFKLEAELYPENIRVLLAEDDKYNADIISTLLTADGEEVQLVDNGNDCSNILAEEKTDILILSFYLPGTDVFKIVEDVRSNKRARELAIIILAGYLSQHDRERLIVAGADRCFIKPLNFQKLREVVKNLACSQI